MKKETKELFWEIINCPCRENAASECEGIIAFQDAHAGWQVPEPWLGDLDSASVLIIGGNPAFKEEEIFPTRRAYNSEDWLGHCPNSQADWTETSVEEFFTKRLDGAKCGSCGQSYVRSSEKNNLQVLCSSNGACAYKRAGNDYWRVYGHYCEVLRTNDVISDTNIAITDSVHCKSGNMIGVNTRTRKQCSFLTKRVIESFAGNASSKHVILLFGAGNARKRLCGVVDNWREESCSVGNYVTWGKNKNKQVKVAHCTVNGVPVIVYFNLLAPSGRTSRFCPVNFMGELIRW